MMAQDPLDESKELEEIIAEETVQEQAVAPDIEDLQKDLAECHSQAAEYLDGWQRARAEFANYKKRVEREREQIYLNTAGKILKRYLEIVDDLERALNNRPQSGEGAAWAGGIDLVYQKLLNILESEGVKRMQAEGQMFDPNMHEAISSEPSPDHESGEIIEVIQPGYMVGERVLRPAIVRVAQ
jgi:molecular chaperone GrpE